MKNLIITMGILILMIMLNMFQLDIFLRIV
jgi:hypothetical protein